MLLSALVLAGGWSHAAELTADIVEHRHDRLGFPQVQAHVGVVGYPSMTAATLASERSSASRANESSREAAAAAETEWGSLLAAALGWIIFVARRRL